MSKKLAGLFLLLGALGIVLGMGFGYVRASLAEEAATEAVVAVEGAVADLTSQELVDAAREAWQAAEELVDDLKEGSVRHELSGRLMIVQAAIDEAQVALDIAAARLAAEEAATEAVAAVQSLLEDLTTQQLIDAAQEAFQAAHDLVEDLHQGAVKTSLAQQLTEIAAAVEEAQQLLETVEAAVEAVEKAEGLTANLSTQSQVNKANNAYQSAKKLVDQLPEGVMQQALAEQLEDIKAAIDQAQQQLHRIAEAAATEAVDSVEPLIASLGTQGSINTATKAYNSARIVVNSLHNGTVKDSLTARLAKIKAAIDQAQKQLDAQWAEVRLNFSGQHYTYNRLVQDLQKLAGRYPDLASTAVVGSSVEGRNIWSITVGKGATNVLVTGSLHASEWLTTPVLMRTIETLLWDYGQEIDVNGESVKEILDRYSITFIPMVNPDGVILVQNGAEAFPHRKEELLEMNDPWGENFSRWKANIRGVDLNRNFAVDWASQPCHETDPVPSYAFHAGPSSESEPETRAVANWVRNNNPVLFLDYHSFGEILYWWYFQSGAQLDRDRAIVRAMRNYSGYRMEAINYNANPSSTSTYWGSKIAGIPSITVEVGHRAPRLLTMGDLSGMFAKVRHLPLIAIINLPGY